MEYQSKTVLLTFGPTPTEYKEFYWTLGERRYVPNEGKVYLEVLHTLSEGGAVSAIVYSFDCTGEWTIADCWNAIKSLEQYK